MNKANQTQQNIGEFLADLSCKDDVLIICPPRRNRTSGYYSSRIMHRHTLRHCDIEMPALPIEQLKWHKGQSCVGITRILVDGSWWLWGFALNECDRILTDREESVSTKFNHKYWGMRRSIASFSLWSAKRLEDLAAIAAGSPN